MKIVAVLHNIRSVHNVGSIFRTADAADIKKIYLCGITPAPADRLGRLRPQFAKVALGAEKFVEWEYAKRAADVIKKLRKDGYKIFAAEQDKKSIPYFKIAQSSILNSKFCLIFGHERAGLPPTILKLADKILEIPMRGAMVRQARHPRNFGNGGRGKESLNVSVAFGIIVFHLYHSHSRPLISAGKTAPSPERKSR